MRLPNLKQSSNLDMSVTHGLVIPLFTYQCGRTTLPFHPFWRAIWTLGWSIDSAQMCVVIRVASLVSCPPKAIVAPAMLSLSVSGRSAQVTTTSAKISLGSGENGRICACFRRVSEVVIHCVVTTGIITACDSVNWGKSIVFEMMCVTFSMGIEPSRRGSQMVAPWSSRSDDSYNIVSIAKITELQGHHTSLMSFGVNALLETNATAHSAKRAEPLGVSAMSRSSIVYVQMKRKENPEKRRAT